MRRILLSLLALSRVWSRVHTGSEVDKGRRGLMGDSSERELFALPCEVGVLAWGSGRAAPHPERHHCWARAGPRPQLVISGSPLIVSQGRGMPFLQTRELAF